jgi:hypothetical protein
MFRTLVTCSKLKLMSHMVTEIVVVLDLQMYYIGGKFQMLYQYICLFSKVQYEFATSIHCAHLDYPDILS